MSLPTMRREYYEPGNGTRYDILHGYVPQPGGEREPHLLFMLTWMKYGGSGGVSIIVSKRVHPSYVAEKMGVGSEDARVLAEFINERTGWK